MPALVATLKSGWSRDSDREVSGVSDSRLAVLKIGSSVLADVSAVPRAVHEVYRQVQSGEKVVVVVSALAGETDRLFRMVGLLDDNAEPHRVAEFVGTGEKQSALLLAIALDRVGITAHVVDPSEISFVADGTPHDADPVDLDRAALDRFLSNNQVIILPGFFANDKCERTVLLGRGGSDDTAMFVAKKLGATCRLVKDVDGIFERDPALPGPAPRRFETITWQDARCVAGKLVQPKAIEFAAANQMHFEVSSLSTTGGTTVGFGPTQLSENAHTANGPLRVALFGAGTVGHGVYHSLVSNPQLFEIVGIAVRRPEKYQHTLPRDLLTDDVEAILGRNPDIVVELMGGNMSAMDVITHGLMNNSDVVTANKAVMAAHGTEFEELAQRYGRLLRYSASVGGSLPAIESIRRISALAPVSVIEGVLNGTCNFVLDHLASGWTLEDAVCEAQRLGYAENDPMQDLNGQDSAEKLRILARIAFGVNLTESDVSLTGISDITTDDATNARNHGQEIRLIARCVKSLDRCTATVSPRHLESNDHLATVRGANNMLRLVLEGGETIIITGKGAGRWPTSESVFADIMDIYRYRVTLPSSVGSGAERQSHM